MNSNFFLGLGYYRMNWTIYGLVRKQLRSWSMHQSRKLTENKLCNLANRALALLWSVSQTTCLKAKAFFWRTISTLSLWKNPVWSKNTWTIPIWSTDLNLTCACTSWLCLATHWRFICTKKASWDLQRKPTNLWTLTQTETSWATCSST